VIGADGKTIDDKARATVGNKGDAAIKEWGL